MEHHTVSTHARTQVRFPTLVRACVSAKILFGFEVAEAVVETLPIQWTTSCSFGGGTWGIGCGEVAVGVVALLGGDEGG